MNVLNSQVYCQFPNQQVIRNHISVQAASEISGYNVQYLRRLLRAGKLEAVRVGQVWLISLSSLEDYLHRNTTNGDHRCGPKCNLIGK